MAEALDPNAALAALEAALQTRDPAPPFSIQTLEEVSLETPPPAAAADRIDGLDDLLDPLVEALRASLGVL